MQRPIPPFRADHVGSLLRSAPLKEARGQREWGEIDDETLRSVEDIEIQKIVARQESVGLKSVTDGEYRRAFWHYDFLAGLDGVEWTDVETAVQFKGAALKPKGIKVTGKLGFSDHPMLDHYRYLRSITSATAKMTIPAPSALHYRGGRPMIDMELYPDMEMFFADLAQAYRAAVRGFADAGCRYLQMDEVYIAYLCDEEQRGYLRDRGDDPEKLLGVYAKLIDTAVAGRPADMVVSMHLCRGNFRSTWMAKGGYERVADVLFNQIGVDAYFMEYDSERAGGFEPLRFVPPGKQVVLGLVTSKTGTLESKDEIKRRLDEASKFVSLDQICLSPQCGFASTEEGNTLAEDEQWAKLRMIVELAKEVWG